MSHPKIVATGPIHPIATEILEPLGPIAIAPDFSVESLVPLLTEAVALVVRGDGVANAAVIAAAPQLKVIGRSGVGYNNIDIDAATARKIPVIFTPGLGARAVAEGAMAMMLALCKHIVYWDQQLKAGNWRSRFEDLTGDLDAATLGIVGFGRIGQILAELARPFNMELLAYDPFVSADVAERLDVRLIELDELLGRADFISLHAAVTDGSRNLITRERLKLIKPGCILVNLARGELIDGLDILHEALSDGRLAAVGLDVFAPEPPDVSHPIFKMPNCLTSPHALGASRAALARIFKSMAEDIAAVLNAKRPQLVVNPEVLG